MAAGFVVGSVLLEGGVLLFIGEQPKFPRHVVGAPWGLRINQPRARYRHKSADVTVWMQINGQGMRAPRDYAYAKPAGMKRIVSLGDSFTIGYEVEYEQCFSTILERELRARGLAVEVLNTGVPGFSTAEECLYLERELLRYAPDLILISFYGNDPGDNVRTGLFKLEGGRLVEGATRYVPAGDVGDYLNTSGIFGLLSERSNAFVLLKETSTRFFKRSMVASILRGQNVAEGKDPTVMRDASIKYAFQLTAALYERLYASARKAGIPLVIHTIPHVDSGRLVETFPLDKFDVRRDGLYFLPAKAVLEPHQGHELLYWKRSLRHWTPFAHEKAGQALAELVVREGLLR